MSKLIAEIKNCGLHDCNCSCYAISEKEAIAIREKVKQVVLAVVNAQPVWHMENVKGDEFLSKESLITKIESIE